MREIKTALLGLGNVNLGLLKILQAKKDQIQNQFEISFNITAVSDSSGIAVSANGFQLDELIQLKTRKEKVSGLSGYLPGIPSETIAQYADAELLIESSPVNMETGNPGLTAARLALEKGWKVVFANKAPMVLAYDELNELARKNRSKIAYSATVCGGLPVINVLQRDLKTANLIRFQGILNATTNHILKALGNGGSMEDAIKEAQRVGAAEADPMYDVLGKDAANKLYIIMKSFTVFNGTIKDIETEGIQNISADDLKNAGKLGNTIKLIASAIPSGNTWKLSVKPVEVKMDSFLGQCEGWEMGIEIQSDLYETISMKIYEEDPLATSAAVLRDAIDVTTK